MYGPGSQPWTLAPFTRVKYERIALVDGGQGLANLVYIDDLVEGLILAGVRPGAVGEVFFISGPAPVPWGEYLAYFAQMLGKPIPPDLPLWQARLEVSLGRWRSRFTRRSPRLDRSDLRLMTQQSVFAIDKARRILGYCPKTSIAEGMSLVESWLRRQGYLSAE